ncbi:MAG: sigma-70 family RNA polymerase sigma factor [Bacteroidota bacterium]|nr:sigma-70 family RNA polymerase sigma factor [Bacteroidota bacterium]
MAELQPTYELIKNKDKESIRVLYERYGKKLFGYARNKWKIGEDENWDLVYKTLYRVIETNASYQFSGEAKFSAFVFTVFINYLRNFYRDKKNLPVEIIELDESFHGNEIPPNDTAPSPSMKLLVAELDQLEDWERILLLMRSQDVPYSEITKYTGKPEDQLKVYYGRLKKKLAERLAEKMKTTNGGAVNTTLDKSQQA